MIQNAAIGNGLDVFRILVALVLSRPTPAPVGPRIPKERVHENRGRQGQCREAKPLGGIRQKLLAGGLDQIFHTKEYQ